MDSPHHDMNSHTGSSGSENTYKPPSGHFAMPIQREMASQSNRRALDIAWVSESPRSCARFPVHVRYPSNGQSNVAYFQPAKRIAAWNEHVASRGEDAQYSSPFASNDLEENLEDGTAQSTAAKSPEENLSCLAQQQNGTGSAVSVQSTPTPVRPAFSSPAPCNGSAISSHQQAQLSNPTSCVTPFNVRQQRDSSTPAPNFNTASFDPAKLLRQQHSGAEYLQARMNGVHPASVHNSYSQTPTMNPPAPFTNTSPCTPQQLPSGYLSTPTAYVNWSQPALQRNNTSNMSHTATNPMVPQVIPQKRPASTISISESSSTTAPQTPQQPPPKYSNRPDPVVVIRPSAIQGLGVFAVKPFRPGEIIMSEHPICAFNHAGIEPTSAISSLAAKLDKLAGYRIAKLSQLSSPPGYPDTNENKFNTNAFTIERKLKPTGGAKAKSAVYPRISRVNHSCLPNAQFRGTWDKHQDECIGTLRATTYIKVGEEILLQYCPDPEWDDTTVRRNRLQAIYGFVCRCAACSEPLNGRTVRGQRRHSIKGLKESLRHGWVAGGVPQLRDISGRICSLIETELGGMGPTGMGLAYGLEYGMVRMELPRMLDPRLAEAYRLQAMLNVKCEDPLRATHLKEKAIRVDTMLFGEDDPEVEEQIVAFQELKEAAERKMKGSGGPEQHGDAEG